MFYLSLVHVLGVLYFLVIKGKTGFVFLIFALKRKMDKKILLHFNWLWINFLKNFIWRKRQPQLFLLLKLVCYCLKLFFWCVFWNSLIFLIYKIQTHFLRNYFFIQDKPENITADFWFLSNFIFHNHKNRFNVLL